MPIGRSAKKSLRKARKNQKTNVSFKNRLKAAVKDFLLQPSQKRLVETQSILDKSIKMNIWHKNKVARMKSAMNKKVLATKDGVKPVAAKKTLKKVVK